MIKKTRVSIGLPVWNGENYIEDAIDSILAQSYQDFELIISDNASIDRTAAICQEYVAKDQRVRYYRNEKNLGAAINYNRVFELSNGEYFKWAAHDDRLAPTYLENCVKKLDEDDSIILCHTLVNFINEKGEIFYSQPSILKNVNSTKPHLRFGNILLTDRLDFDSFALIRSRILSKTSLVGNFASSNVILRAELCLLGPYYEIPEPLFYVRYHHQRASRTNQSHQDWAVWFDPSNAGKRLFPHWRVLIEYYKTIQKFNLTAFHGMACKIQLIRWVFSNFNWGRMLLEVIVGFAPGLFSFYWKIRQKLRKILGYEYW